MARALLGQNRLNFPRGGQALPKVVYEDLAVFLANANVLLIPILSGWTEAVTGSGVTTQDVMRQTVTTGTTASSTARRYVEARGFGVDASADWKFDFDKKTYLIFNYWRYQTDAQVIARFQLKEVTTEGALAAKGFGLRADNFALTGESYGTALGTVDLGVTITTDTYRRILIIHDPSVPKIEFYVDGVLKGTQSTAANMPSGVAGVQSYLMHSIINGLAGGTNVQSAIMQPRIWQAR